jgi:hypothetical protein
MQLFEFFGSLSGGDLLHYGNGQHSAKLSPKPAGAFVRGALLFMCEIEGRWMAPVVVLRRGNCLTFQVDFYS